MVMVVQSQHQVVDIMNKKNEMLKTALERLSNEYLSQDLHKVTVEKLAHNSQKGVDDVNAAINKLVAEMEQKKTENDACQAQKVTGFPLFTFGLLFLLLSTHMYKDKRPLLLLYIRGNSTSVAGYNSNF